MDFRGDRTGRRKVVKVTSSCLAIVGLLMAAVSQAATTVDVGHPYAYGANIGWVNAQGDGTNGAVLGQSFCTGYLWSANCGWISLGNGPTNGWQYSNTAANDWGVNHDGYGYLRGFAYGANIGWINFETNGNARIDLMTGNLSGYAYGANIGWISLSNAFASVQTDILSYGPDSDSDGIPDAWEYQTTGTLTNLANGGDADNDNVPDQDEFTADTDPLNGSSHLAITALNRSTPTNLVTWSVEPTRFYRLEQAQTISNQTVWSDSGFGVFPPNTTPTVTRSVVNPASTTQFYRARAIVPLAP